MITGAHIIVYSKDPEADRKFFRDILNFSAVDAGHGWLIKKRAGCGPVQRKRVGSVESVKQPSPSPEAAKSASISPNTRSRSDAGRTRVYPARATVQSPPPPKFMSYDFAPLRLPDCLDSKFDFCHSAIDCPPAWRRPAFARASHLGRRKSATRFRQSSESPFSAHRSRPRHWPDRRARSREEHAG